MHPFQIGHRWATGALIVSLAWLAGACSLGAPPGTQLAAGQPTTSLPAPTAQAPTLTPNPESMTAAPPNLPLSNQTPIAIITQVPAGTSTTPATPPPPGTILVDSFDQESPFVQNGNCTLGEAIAAANTRQAVDGCQAGAEESRIVLQPGTYTLKVVDRDPQVALGELVGSGGASGLPPIGTILSLDGNGATILRQAGAPNFRILEVYSGQVTLNNLTLSNGNASTDGEGGGGLYVSGPEAQVTLNNVTVSSNISSGADAPGGGIANLGTLALHDSRVAQNSALSSGGGIGNAGSLTIQSSLVISNTAKDSANAKGGGGGLFNEGSGSRAVVEDTRFEANQATQGGGVFNSGMITMTHSLIVSNTASEDSKSANQPQGGGGLDNAGDGASAYIGDSLIAGNSAPLSTGGGVYNSQKLTIYRTLIQGDQAETGNGIYNERVTGVVQISYSCLIGDNLVNAASAQAVLAPHLWWDSPLGPTPGVNFSGEVNYIPFLPAMPNACSRWGEKTAP